MNKMANSGYENVHIVLLRFPSLTSPLHESTFLQLQCASQVCCSISLSGLCFTILIIAIVRLYKNALIMVLCS